MVPMPKMIGAAANRWCIQVIAPTAMMKAETAPTIGHGEGSTRWESWCLTCAVAICGLSVSGAVLFGTYSSQKSNLGISTIPAVKGFPYGFRSKVSFGLVRFARRHRLWGRLAHGVEGIGQSDGVQPVIVAVLDQRGIDVKHHRHFALFARGHGLLGETEAVDL